MHGVDAGRSWRLTGCRLWLGALLAHPTLATADNAPPALPVFTTVAQIAAAVRQDWRVTGDLDLTGVVCAANPAKALLVLQDASGVELLKLDWVPPSLQPGQRARVVGRDCEVSRGPGGLSLGRAPVVDNDGEHGMQARSGTVPLAAGLNPIRLDWFNGGGDLGLEVEWAGPGQPPRKIPASRLFRRREAPETGLTNLVNGLDYLAYEGDWSFLPNFGALPAARAGVTADFDCARRTRDNQVGLAFSGWLQVPEAGTYEFTTRSDDGSRLFVGEPLPRVEPLGAATTPAPHRLSLGRRLDTADNLWAAIEGRVDFAGEQFGRLELTLTEGLERLRVTVLDGTGLCPTLLLHSRIRAVGVARSTSTVAGETTPGVLLVTGPGDITMLEPAADLWTATPLHPIGELGHPMVSGGPAPLVRVQGRVCAADSDGLWGVADATGQIALDTPSAQVPESGAAVEVLGQLERTGTHVLLRSAVCRRRSIAPEFPPASGPPLTTAEQIQRLKREEAQHGRPVLVRGVVTCSDFYQGFVLQDATRGVFVEPPTPNGLGRPEVGENWEVQGITGPGLFSPLIKAARLTRLGQGRLPEPIQATWDQLLNGSLDVQYAEIQGMVTAVQTNGIKLLTRGGKVRVNLAGLAPETLHQYKNALVRLRGCLLAVWDLTTHQLKVGEVTMGQASVSVEQPAPADPFAVPLKGPRDLLRFDAQAGAFQRVKVAGQIMHERAGEYFLTDGTNGLRFTAQDLPRCGPGDWVEAVGFPELGGPALALREAAVRQLRPGALPAAQELPLTNLLSADHDATRVRIGAVLLGVRHERGERVLELQAGLRTFLARAGGPADALDSLPTGSRLAVTGTYAGQGGNRGVGREIDSFELLLNSAGDVQVLARPPWWTLRRVLVVLGALSFVLLAATLWGVTLKRQVNAQTAVIRQKAEREATLEERARIARELHDTLEQALAGLGLQLSALSGTLRAIPAESQRILAMACSMVRHSQEEARRTVRNLRTFALDRNDLLAALRQLAEQSRGAWPVDTQVEISGPPRPLPPAVESHLLRVAQEATTNALKHAQARQIRIALGFRTDTVTLAIQDDGCGFDAEHAAPSAAGHFGLLGMRERAEKLGGALHIRSAPGAGTTIEVTVPCATLPRAATAA